MNDAFLSEFITSLKDGEEDLSQVTIFAYPIVKRGSNLPRYMPLSDGRLVEYDFDKLVFEDNSKFQNIKIVNSASFGRALLLDNVLNLAESDDVYTGKLLRKDCGDIYTDKEVLLLGGGDGAALNVLLQDEPKHVTMVEIDRQVIEVCRQYMPNVCGTALDQLKGARHEIIIDDCIPQLQRFVSEKRKFDAIFNDLTDVPVGSGNADNQQQVWDVLQLVMSQCVRCLKEDGVCVAHVTGSGATPSLEQYEKMLKERMPLPVTFTKREVWVPSFLEYWVFYDVRLQTAESNRIDSS
jgi:spermine synthase